MKLYPLTLLGLIALFCSCAATSVKKTWKSPDYHGGPVTKFAVLAVDERGLLRQAFENRLAAQLRKGGATAMTTFDLLSLPEINQDKPAAGRRLQAAGAQAVVIMKLANISSSYREVRPGTDRYAGYITGIEPGTWYDYYNVAFSDISPTYGNLRQKVYLETSIFDLSTAKSLWSGVTETTVTENMDRVAEMDPIVEKVVAAMRRDGMVP